MTIKQTVARRYGIMKNTHSLPRKPAVPASERKVGSTVQKRPGMFVNSRMRRQMGFK